MSLEAFKDVLRRLNKGRIDAAADNAIASWAEELGVSLEGDAVAEAGGEDAADSDADEAEEAEEAEEAVPALPRVPKPKGRKKLEPPTGAALGAVADARGRALRRLAALLAAAAKKSQHKGLHVNYVDNAAFQEAVTAAAPPVAHFRVAHGKGTLLVPGYSWLFQDFIATNGLLRPEDKGVANMRFRFQIEAELRGRNKSIKGSVLLVSLVLWYRGTSSSAVQLLNHVTGGVMSSNSLRDLLAKYLKTHNVYEEFWQLMQDGRLIIVFIDNLFVEKGRVRTAAPRCSPLTRHRRLTKPTEEEGTYARSDLTSCAASIAYGDFDTKHPMPAHVVHVFDDRDVKAYVSSVLETVTLEVPDKKLQVDGTSPAAGDSEPLKLTVTNSSFALWMRGADFVVTLDEGDHEVPPDYRYCL